jgi:hypothetical protein
VSPQRAIDYEAFVHTYLPISQRESPQFLITRRVVDIGDAVL